MNKNIFTKKSIQRISSPEQLTDYIKVSNPGVWLILIVIVLMLTGIIVWGAYGHLDTILSTAGVSEDGVYTCYIKEEDIGEVNVGLTVKIRDSEYTITDISVQPTEITDTSDDYFIHLGNFAVGDFVYEATVDARLEDGIYPTDIVTSRVSPLSFIVN